MTKEFIIWAQASGASEALVNAYAGNIGAQRFYDRHGFEAQSIQRNLPLAKGPLTKAPLGEQNSRS